MQNSRRFLLLGASAAAVVVAAGAVLAIVLTGGDDEPAVQDVTWTKAPASGNCPKDGRAMVAAYFEPPTADADMRAAAEQLGGDAKSGAVLTETQDEAYARFLEIFAGKPELLSLANKETLPASVNVLPVDGVSLNALADHLRDALTEADDVQVGGCAVPSR